MSLLKSLFLLNLYFVATISAASFAPLPDSSLYQLQSEWTNDRGEKLHLEKLQGKMRVLTLFFGHCQSSCPMVLSNLKGLEKGLSKDWYKYGGIVLVTLDPQRDSAESLAEFRKRMGMSPEGWTLLRGTEEDTRELAMTLGVSYRPSKTNGGVNHNAVIVILDEKGRIIKRHEGAIETTALLSEYTDIFELIHKSVTPHPSE